MTLAVLAGAVGAVMRYLVGLTQTGRGVGPTLVVNVVGAFVLGVIARDGISGGLEMAVGGFAGGFTTFSTWMVETLTDDDPKRAAIRMGWMLVAGLGAAGLGLAA